MPIRKEGVGKTTLCVTFANYLVTKGVRVVVIDCDFQHSIMKCRKADIRKYGEQEMPYEVWAYEANDKAMMTSLMEKLHNDPEIDVVLIDSPGSLKAEGLVPIFVNSDIIVVPDKQFVTLADSSVIQIGNDEESGFHPFTDSLFQPVNKHEETGR